MELYEQMILKILEKQPGLIAADTETLKEAFDSECYRALVQIREILKNDALNDEECFNKIEEIVCVFESLGSGGGVRHDFG